MLSFNWVAGMALLVWCMRIVRHFLAFECIAIVCCGFPYSGMFKIMTLCVCVRVCMTPCPLQCDLTSVFQCWRVHGPCSGEEAMSFLPNIDWYCQPSTHVLLGLRNTSHDFGKNVDLFLPAPDTQCACVGTGRVTLQVQYVYVDSLNAIFMCRRTWL